MKTINLLNEELELHKSMSNKDDLEQMKKIKVNPNIKPKGTK